MADAIVRGVIQGNNQAQFQTTLSCSNSAPYGSISGEFEVNQNGRGNTFIFRSNSPSRIITRRAGITRYVYAAFGNVTLINRRTGVVINNARIVLTARKNANGRRSATLTIYRPGRMTLTASGFLANGRVFVGRNVSCQLLLQ
jgi:hypothetical protein